MEPPPSYKVLAFLPVILAVVALVALYSYHKGEEARRVSRQKPEEVLDALGIRPGMRVGEWRSEDTFFLERIARRVGREGRVYAIRPRRDLAESLSETPAPVEVTLEPPDGLHAVLVLCLRSADQDTEDLNDILTLSFERLVSGGRFGLIGVGSEHARGFIPSEQALETAQRAGFSLLKEEGFLKPQFFLVLEK